MPKEPDQQTIDVFAKRSNRTVMWIAAAFAVGGALLGLIPIVSTGGGVSMLWGMWIPLCFITIPPIHYLCRHVQRLQQRVEILEKQLGERNAA